MKSLRDYMDILQKIEEGGITLPNPDGSLPPGAFTAADQEKLNQRVSAQASGATAGGVPIGSTPPGINRLTGKPIEPAAEPAPAAEKPVVPLSQRYTPGISYPAAYTVAYQDKEYKFAGRDAPAPGTGPKIIVGAGAIGIRGLSPVTIELGNDGKYYAAGQ
jgi:hypothetical protein